MNGLNVTIRTKIFLAGFAALFAAACGMEISDSEGGGDFNLTGSITPPPPPVPGIPPGETWSNVTVTAETFANVLGTFDSPADATAEGWVATGVFAAGLTDWQGAVTNNSPSDVAVIGEGMVSTCEIEGPGSSCDGPQGTLTSPAFDVTMDTQTVNFLFKGGLANVGVRVLRDSDRAIVLADFRPEACGPPWVQNDGDWYYIDMSGSIGETVVVQIYDEDSGGCGFISFDHFYLNANGRGTLGAATLPPLAGTGVTVSPDGGNRDNLLPGGGFDDAQASVAAGWEATGAFAGPTAVDAWSGTTTTTGVFVNTGAVSTQDIGGGGPIAPTGDVTLTWPVSGNFLNFLMSGGDGTVPVGIQVSDLVGNSLLDYRPNDCNDINGDDDWKYIDTSAVQGAVVNVRLFDDETALGCGFVSFDHLYTAPNFWAEDPTMSNTAENAGTLADNGFLSFNVEIPADAYDQVIGDFEDSIQMFAAGWTATGSFVATPTDANDWNGNLASIIGTRVQSKLASTCELNMNAEGCDGPMGSLTSPAIAVVAERPYLNVLFSGGADGSQPVGLRVFNPGNNLIIREHLSMDCALFDPKWVTFDLTDRVGTNVILEAYDEFDGGCGFMTIDHVHMSAERADALN